MLTLVWDVDDVLNDFMRCWFEHYWLPEHSSCTLSYSDITANPPHDILGISLEKYQQSLDEFRLCDSFEQMRPIPEIHEWFGKYGHLFRHIALTSVSRIAAPVSAKWVLNHFGDWIRAFNFIPSSRANEKLAEYDPTKSDYLNWLNKADVFIDDNESNIIGLGNSVVKSFIIDRPWNSSNLSIDKLLYSLIDYYKDKEQTA